MLNEEISIVVQSDENTRSPASAQTDKSISLFSNKDK